MKISVFNVVYAVGSLAVASLITYFGLDYFVGNTDALMVLVTFFSILSGFLIAIIAIVGDPAMVSGSSWRAFEKARPLLVVRITRYKTLFVGYLLTLLTIFTALLIRGAVDHGAPSWIDWLEGAALFLGSLCFLFSLRLPGALADMQQQRFDAILEARRQGGNPT